MKQLIEDHLEWVLTITDRKIEMIKEADNCWICNHLLDHVEVYQEIIKHLLSER
jgi:tRNA U54 and U55 pseudouridine synthase Pus10